MKSVAVKSGCVRGCTRSKLFGHGVLRSLKTGCYKALCGSQTSAHLASRGWNFYPSSVMNCTSLERASPKVLWLHAIAIPPPTREGEGGLIRREVLTAAFSSRLQRRVIGVALGTGGVEGACVGCVHGSTRFHAGGEVRVSQEPVAKGDSVKLAFGDGGLGLV